MKFYKLLFHYYLAEHKNYFPAQDRKETAKATKNHNQVEAYILDQRISKNGGWLTTTDQLMCLQHLYLGSHVCMQDSIEGGGGGGVTILSSEAN
jgi:hypothetical protein